MLCPHGARASPLPDQVPGAQGPGIPTQMTPSLLQAHPPEGVTGRAHCQARGKLSGGLWEAVTAGVSDSQALVSPDVGRGEKGRHQREVRPGASSHSTATFSHETRENCPRNIKANLAFQAQVSRKETRVCCIEQLVVGQGLWASTQALA